MCVCVCVATSRRQEGKQAHPFSAYIDMCVCTFSRFSPLHLFYPSFRRRRTFSQKLNQSLPSALKTPPFPPEFPTTDLLLPLFLTIIISSLHSYVHMKPFPPHIGAQSSPFQLHRPLLLYCILTIPMSSKVSSSRCNAHKVYRGASNISFTYSTTRGVINALADYLSLSM